MKNKYEVFDSYVVIFIKTKSRGTHECLVDIDDFNRVKGMNWSLHKTGYACCNIGNKSSGFHSTILMHRLIQSFPEGWIDHKNKNKLDNRKPNLRECSSSENKMNTNARSDNKLGVKGVSFWGGRYDVRVTVNSKTKRIGLYKTLDEAKAAYKEASLKLQGEFSTFNQ